MKTLAKTLATLTIAIIAFSNIALAGIGEIIDINPSGVVMVVLDLEDLTEKQVLNPGKKFDVEVGSIIEFETKSPNGNGASHICTDVIDQPN